MMNKVGTTGLSIGDRYERSQTAGDPRGYNRLLALLLLPPLLLLIAASLLLEPLRGDLTRIGGYTENQFGWTKPQVRFEPPLVQVGTYQKPYDVVVLGDSFSSSPFGTDQTDPGVYWPNHLAQRSGMSVLSLNMFKHGLGSVLANPHFQTSPPRLVVLQIVESMLGLYFVQDARGYLGSTKGQCGAPPAQTTSELGPLVPRAAATQPWVRDRSRGLAFGQAVNYLWKTIRREAFGIDTTGVQNFALRRSDLFSNRASDRLLVHARELDKVAWSEVMIRALRCNLVEAQNRVEANGKTRFILMVAPDKLTIYGNYLVDSRYSDLSRLSNLFEGTGVRTVDLRTPLQRALNCGMIDLYLPNDTHWSSSGHAIAADAILRAFGVAPESTFPAVSPFPETCRATASLASGKVAADGTLIADRYAPRDARGRARSMPMKRNS